MKKAVKKAVEISQKLQLKTLREMLLQIKLQEMLPQTKLQETLLQIKLQGA